ncbi:MAG: HEPN domain-containing protein [Euryarchaeota archaeon]|nr:HEPN domain-containing protein [Euryarchaeota archaeon]
MAARESLLPDDWFARVKADLSAAEILLTNKGDPQVAAALIQQGVEKHLKGWFLSKGWRLAKVHDLQRLLDDAVVHDKKLARHYRLCERLTAFYFVDRCPFTVKPPDPVSVKDIFAEALKFVDELRP